MQQQLSFFTAVGVLVAFRDRKLNLDEEVFEQCFDTVVSLLEDCNNEKYRVLNRDVKKTLEG